MMNRLTPADRLKIFTLAQDQVREMKAIAEGFHKLAMARWSEEKASQAN